MTIAFVFAMALFLSGFMMATSKHADVKGWGVSMMCLATICATVLALIAGA